MAVLRLIICLFCFLITIGAIAQDSARIDEIIASMPEERDTSRMLALHELFMEYIFVDPTEAAVYAEEALHIAEELDNPNFLARACNLYGVAMQRTSNFDEAIAFGEQALAIYRELGNMERVSAMYNNIGNSFRNQGEIIKALEYHMESLRIKEEIGVDDEALAASYWNIGNLHGDIPNLAESNVWYRKAEKVYAELELEQDLVAIRYNLGLNLSDMDSLDQAMAYFESAIEYYIANDLHNDLAAAYDNLGQLQSEAGKLELSESYFLRSLDISQRYGERTLVGLTNRRLGRLYTRLGRYSEAEELLLSALTISQETGVRKKMITDYLALAELEAARGNYRTAYEYHVEYAKLENEVLNEESLERINELEIRYQTARKEKELLQQESEIEILEQKTRAARAQNLLLIFAIIAALIVFASVYYGLRQKVQRTRVENEQLDRELTFKKSELTGFTLQLAHKNELLEELKGRLRDVKSDVQDKNKINGIMRTIDHNLQDADSWEHFQRRFEEVHKDFNSNAKSQFPAVTANDLRLMSLIKMNLSSREIANLLNISQDGIKKARYRLRKKMDLDSEMSLEAVVQAI